MPVELILYVNPQSPASHKAVKAVEAFLAAHPQASCRMTVRDVDECWAAAEQDRILFAPTLVVKGGDTPAWLVGDMGSPDTLAAFINVEEREESSDGRDIT